MWITLRAFGAEGVRERIRDQVAMAHELADALAREPDFEVLAPVLFSLVVFRFARRDFSPEENDAANRRILEAVNAEGKSFISHAMLGGRYVLRAAIGNVRTERRHLETLLASIRAAASEETRKARAS
jgi:aromatic-L-amino-acid decarboxylase